MRLPIGTRSLLWGGHQFLLHPIFVALAWRRLYGAWPRDPRIWCAFVVHDWGYWGLPNMDGPEGTAHPLSGANLMGRWFDRTVHVVWLGEWWRFTAAHSRTFAREWGLPESPLMRADKLATALYPFWLYVALMWLSGEWHEYLARWQAAGTYPGQPNLLSWARCLQANWARFRDPQAASGRAYGGE